jgi:phosphatidylglycerophosphatase A
MKLSKKLFILSIISIFFLIYLTNSLNQEPIKGTINSIKTYPKVTYLSLEENNITITIFTTTPLKIEKNQKIAIYGKYEEYKDKTQFIADKIIKISH